MATYNGENYIREQIDSILQQMADGDELIISDDSSVDNTVAIIKAIKDPRIKLFEDQKFRNPIWNFEFAISKASGDIIFLSDQDDIWMPGKIKRYLDFFDKGYDVVISDCRVVDKTLNVLQPSFFKSNRSGKGIIKNLIKNSYLGCCLAFHRSLLPIILPFPKAIPMHDIWIGIIAELKGNPIFIDDMLLLYRRHDLNASPTAVRSHYSLLARIGFRWNIIRRIPLILRRAKGTIYRSGSN